MGRVEKTGTGGANSGDQEHKDQGSTSRAHRNPRSLLLSSGSPCHGPNCGGPRHRCSNYRREPPGNPRSPHPAGSTYGFVRVRSVPIGSPLPDISQHVVQSEGVRSLGLTGSVVSARVGDIPGNVVKIAVSWGRCSCTRGVFPLRFGREPSASPLTIDLGFLPVNLDYWVLVSLRNDGVGGFWDHRSLQQRSDGTHRASRRSRPTRKPFVRVTW